MLLGCLTCSNHCLTGPCIEYRTEGIDIRRSPTFLIHEIYGHRSIHVNLRSGCIYTTFVTRSNHLEGMRTCLCKSIRIRNILKRSIIDLHLIRISRIGQVRRCTQRHLVSYIIHSRQIAQFCISRRKFRISHIQRVRCISPSERIGTGDIGMESTVSGINSCDSCGMVGTRDSGLISTPVTIELNTELIVALRYIGYRQACCCITGSDCKCGTLRPQRIGDIAVNSHRQRRNVGSSYRNVFCYNIEIYLNIVNTIRRDSKSLIGRRIRIIPIVIRSDFKCVCIAGI